MSEVPERDSSVNATPRRAVLFDLDDTLYEYAPCNAAGLTAAHAVLASAASIDVDAFRALHDRVREELAVRLRGRAASHNRAIFFKLVVERHTGRSQGALAHEMFTRYWSAFLARMTPAPGAHDALAELARRYALALVTNHTTDVQLRKIERLDLERFFPVVVTSEEAGVEKPDARIFEVALEALGVAASSAVMIGDNAEVDVLGAANAGLRAILSTEFRRTPDEGAGAPRADLVVPSVRDMPSAVDELLRTTP